MPNYALTDRELQTVLAALRYYQETVEPADRGDDEYFADVQPLTDAQIDKLCERLSGFGLRRPPPPKS